MRNHWKIIRTLYSPHFITELLLILEMALLIQILAICTASASYYRTQMRLADALWKKGNYIYFTPPDTTPGDSREPLPLQELMKDHPEVEAVYQGSANNEGVLLKEKTLTDASGNPRGIILIHYNDAMREKASDYLTLAEGIDPKETAALFVTPEFAGEYPPGTTLTIQTTDFQSIQTEAPNVRETVYTVCGVIRKDPVPVTNRASEGYMMAESLSVYTKEMLNINRCYVMIACGEEEIPAHSAMLKLQAGTDADSMISVLNEEYAAYGKFYSYAYMRSYSREHLMWIKSNILLGSILLLLVFFSHLVGYLSVTTRNKARINALLSINGLTPAGLAAYNSASFLLLLLAALVIGLPIVPLTEKWSKVIPYGGHAVMWECLAVLFIFALLMVYTAVRARLRKGNTILLYRKGT